MTTAGSMVRIFVALCLVCSVAGAADGGSTVGDMPGQLPGTIGESMGTPGPAPLPDRPADDLCDTTPGDVNLDGSFNIADCYLLGQFLYCQTELPPQAIVNSDMDGDCSVVEDDMNYCIDSIFGGGDPPADCVCSKKEFSPCRCTLTGDVNLDGNVNIADAVALNYFLNCNATPTDEQLIQSDVNGDCVVDLDDSQYIVDLVYSGGDDPVPCLCAEKELLPCGCRPTGDVNLDGNVNIADAVALNYFLNCNATPTDEQLIQSDVNGDCVVDLDDSQYIVDLVYFGGDDPVPCTCAEKELLPCGCRPTGDVNLDGNVNIADAVALNYFLNCNATPTDEQLIQSDVNGDCVVDLDDSQYIVDLVYFGGDDPVPCTCAEKEGPNCE